MKVPMSMRYYERKPDGSAVRTSVEGNSPFMKASRFLLDEMPSHDGIYNFAGELFREVQPVAITDGYYSQASILMKESPVAQLLRLWYRNIDKVLAFVFKIEQPRLKAFGAKEGEVLPWWSITRWIASTQIEA